MSSKDSRLTWSVLSSYGGRKKPGRISILINSETGEVHTIPRSVEHIDYVMNLLGTEDYDVVRDKAQKLVPSHIEVIINPETGREEVTSIHTGDSGLEIRFGVRHEEAKIIECHEVAKQYAQMGEIPVSKNIIETINTRYALKN